MIAMKYVHTLGGEGILVIQEVNQKIEPISYLQKAWVNVYGVPFEIRSFLPLWVVGSILGQLRKWICATLGKWGWFEFWLQ
jgi:hypothetical protein